MKVTSIVVSAGRTFNHPFESYSNLRPQVTLSASMDEGDDYEKVVKDLQSKAEHMVEDHKRALLDSLNKLEEMTRRERQIVKLESLIKTSQDELGNLRDHPIESPLLFAPEEIRDMREAYCDECNRSAENCICD